MLDCLPNVADGCSCTLRLKKSSSDSPWLVFWRLMDGSSTFIPRELYVDRELAPGPARFRVFAGLILLPKGFLLVLFMLIQSSLGTWMGLESSVWLEGVSRRGSRVTVGVAYGYVPGNSLISSALGFLPWFVARWLL